MKFLSLQPFIPSGKDYEASRQLFLELGFTISWDAGGYTGFAKDECRFILQELHHREFAENLMISVAVDDVEAFSAMVQQKGLVQKYGVRIGKITEQPYGRECNLIDIAGVCWHFVQ